QLSISYWHLSRHTSTMNLLLRYCQTHPDFRHFLAYKKHLQTNDHIANRFFGTPSAQQPSFL
ncbi:MAG: hypothetical protein V1753_01380, partial [Pseudomonadota bacterium]